MNPFIPTDSEFEICGFYEEFWDGDTYAFLGIRDVGEPDRPLGTPGRIAYSLQAPLALVKGYKRKQTTVKAAPGQPRRVIAMLQMVCGRKHDTGFRHNRAR